MVLWIFAIISVLLAVWSLWLRDWLEHQTWPWSQAFFKWLEPWEITLWRNSKTIFIARLKMLVGALLTIFTQIGAISIEPIMPLLPEQHHGLIRFAVGMVPFILTILGVLDEYLRRDTTKPVELVAIEINQIPEDVRNAIIAAEKAKEKAVAVVQEAKAEGRIQS